MKNPKLKGLKNRRGKNNCLKQLFYARALCSCSFLKRGHKTREKGKERERREHRTTFCSFVYDFIAFLFLYIVYYIHTNKRGIISETTQIIRRCSRSLNENTREVTLTLCTQKRVSSLYRSFLNAFVVVLVSRGFANKRARRKRECTI